MCTLRIIPEFGVRKTRIADMGHTSLSASKDLFSRKCTGRIKCLWADDDEIEFGACRRSAKKGSVSNFGAC